MLLTQDASTGIYDLRLTWKSMKPGVLQHLPEFNPILYKQELAYWLTELFDPLTKPDSKKNNPVENNPAVPVTSTPSLPTVSTVRVFSSEADKSSTDFDEAVQLAAAQMLSSFFYSTCK
jgi:hypothetical protein